VVHDAVAAARRGALASCVLHTDRVPIPITKFVQALDRHQMLGWMGHVGAAGDNAAMESFFGLLQNNLLNRHNWTPGSSCGSPS
jgi:putative transposase